MSQKRIQMWMRQELLIRRKEWKQKGGRWWVRPRDIQESQLDQTELSEREQALLNRWTRDYYNRHKPLQYCLGTQPFLGHPVPLLVRPPILIPRWETEEWCERLANHIHRLNIKGPYRILDICTGSGCLALGLAYLIQHAQVVGIDKSRRAINLARINQRKWNIPSSRVSFIEGDIFEFDYTNESFDLIVSNPPYVTQQEYMHLDKHVKEWEDKEALVAKGPLATEFYSYISRQAPFLLKPSRVPHIPRLVMEYGGRHQTDHVKQAVMAAGFHQVDIWKDLAQQDRCVVVY